MIRSFVIKKLSSMRSPRPRLPLTESHFSLQQKIGFLAAGTLFAMSSPLT
jgi:hypothetical protein